MTKPISIVVRSATVALIAATLVPGALWAESGTEKQEALVQAAAPARTAPSGPSREACDKARNDAWFMRQLQMTDGNILPPVELPIRADCRADRDNDNDDHKIARSMTYEKLSTSIGGE